MWGAGKKAAKQAVDLYFRKLSSSEIPHDEELAQCYAAKIALDSAQDSEERVRTIQSLANMQHPACILPLLRELMARAKEWPHAGRHVDVQAVSTLLLESLVRYSTSLPRQPPDGVVGCSTDTLENVPSPS